MGTAQSTLSGAVWGRGMYLPQKTPMMGIVTETPERSAGQTRGDAEHQGLYALMQRHIDGDWRAFDRLHERLAPRLRAMISRMVGRQQDIDDLVQMTFLRAHLARSRFAPRGSDPNLAVVGWYFTIARNTAMEFLRQQGREARRREQGAAEDPGSAIVDETPNVETLAVDREAEAEILERLQAALAQLPPAQREVVQLHKLKGLSMAEISQRLTVGEGAIRVRAHRAYRSLQRLLKSRSSET